jgi:hypothetical protein
MLTADKNWINRITVRVENENNIHRSHKTNMSGQTEMTGR